MFCLGVYDVLKIYENNACEMTYMFQTPEYMVRNEYAIMSFVVAWQRVLLNAALTLVVLAYPDIRIYPLILWQPKIRMS